MNTTLTAAPTTRASALSTNLAFGALLLVGMLVHAYNMFGFPARFGDEGIYMSQAFALLRLDAITPYAYWYDHAPGGWVLIAVWVALTGGFYTFGTSVDSGRVLMLVLHVIALMLIFRVILRATGNSIAALASGLLFTLSPLSVDFGRMVLLENIMIVWALLALAFMLRHDGKIWQLFYSGICFGMAVLTKENSFLLLPAFVYALWSQVEQHHARFARAGWLFTALTMISLYPLYAALRKELFDPSFSTPLAGGTGQVSLLGTLLWQLNQGGGAPWDASSNFFEIMRSDWLARDPLLLGLGAAASLWNIVRGDHQRRMIGLLTPLAMISILSASNMHNGTVGGFYIISVLPFLALNVGAAAFDLARRSGIQLVLPALVVAALLAGWGNLERQRDLFETDSTRTERQALEWVRKHVPSQAQIIIDDTLWVDLRDGPRGQPSFSGAHSHWKVARDPAVFRDLLHEDWQLIDYLVVNRAMEQAFQAEPDRLPFQAYSRSIPVASFGEGDARIEIRKVNHAGIAVAEMLESGYRGFRDQFIKEGQARGEKNYVDARDQSAAMLMAVWMDDRATFDVLWHWSQVNLQSPNGQLYLSNDPDAAIQTATEADTDAAVALLLAERRWGDPQYGSAAQTLIQAIWQYAVVDINGTPYVAAGNWAIRDDLVVFAPATFAPYAYHMFAEADPEHNWWYVLDVNYRLLSTITSPGTGTTRAAGLPPSYIGIDRVTGELVPNPSGTPFTGNLFSTDAAQVFWRVGLDAQWHNDPRALTFLSARNAVYERWIAEERLVDTYSHTGSAVTDTESLTMYSAILPGLMQSNPEAGHKLYNRKLATLFTRSSRSGQWGATPDLTQQRWAWLATGIYTNALKHEWGQR